MKQHEKKFADAMATTGSLSFDKQYLSTGDVGLNIKDGRRALYFLNTGKFCDGESGIILGTAYANKIIGANLHNGFDVFMGPAYKGITIASAATAELYRTFGINKPWAYIRKEVKGHGEKGDVVGTPIFDGCRILLGDDVISSAKTKFDEMEKIKNIADSSNIEASVMGLIIAVDRQQKAVTGGKLGEGGEQLDISASQYFTEKTGLPVHCVLDIREVMNHLYEGRVMGPDGEIVVTDKALQEFEKYQKEFGV